MDAEENLVDLGYVAPRPKLRQRMWRALGFRYHLGDEPVVPPGWKGWIQTNVHLEFGFADRLRLLLTGRLHVRLTQEAPEKITEVVNRTDWQIKAPGEPR